MLGGINIIIKKHIVECVKSHLPCFFLNKKSFFILSLCKHRLLSRFEVNLHYLLVYTSTMQIFILMMLCKAQSPSFSSEQVT